MSNFKVGKEKNVEGYTWKNEDRRQNKMCSLEKIT